MNKKELDIYFKHIGLGTTFFLLFMVGNALIKWNIEFAINLIVMLVILLVAGYSLDKFIKIIYKRVR